MLDVPVVLRLNGGDQLISTVVKFMCLAVKSEGPSRIPNDNNVYLCDYFGLWLPSWSIQGSLHNTGVVGLNRGSFALFT